MDAIRIGYFTYLRARYDCDFNAPNSICVEVHYSFVVPLLLRKTSGVYFVLSFPLCESLFKSSWIPPRRLASLLRMWCTFDIRLLERDRYYQRKANAHKARLKKIQNRRPGTGTIDNLPPRSLADNKKNDAKKMMQVEKHWKIDRANKQLLNRMLSIENRKTSQYAPASGRTFSLNVSSRKKKWNA